VPDLPLEKLLQGAFKGEEWDYLSQHPVFVSAMQRVKPNHTSYENLVNIGTLLLRQREELSLALRRVVGDV